MGVAPERSVGPVANGTTEGTLVQESSSALLMRTNDMYERMSRIATKVFTEVEKRLEEDPGMLKDMALAKYGAFVMEYMRLQGDYDIRLRDQALRREELNKHRAEMPKDVDLLAVQRQLAAAIQAMDPATLRAFQLVSMGAIPMPNVQDAETSEVDPSAP